MRLLQRLLAISVFAGFFGGFEPGASYPRGKVDFSQTGDPIFVGAGDISSCTSNLMPWSAPPPP